MPAVLFDFDGLMIDSERMLADCMIEVLAGWGATVTIVDFGHLFGTTEAGDEWDRLIRMWCGRSNDEFESVLWPLATPRIDGLPLLPGVTEVLDMARSLGWKVGLGTGSLRDRVEARLARLGVVDLFDEIVTRGDVARGKPAPDIYLELADRLGVEAADCVVLEDSIPGCSAATAAGMRVIGCPSTVNAHCAFPATIQRVTSLLHVDLDASMRSEPTSGRGLIRE